MLRALSGSMKCQHQRANIFRDVSLWGRSVSLQVGEQNYCPIHPIVVEIVHSGTKWWMITISRAMSLACIKINDISCSKIACYLSANAYSMYAKMPTLVGYELSCLTYSCCSRCWKHQGGPQESSPLARITWSSFFIHEPHWRRPLWCSSPKWPDCCVNKQNP